MLKLSPGRNPSGGETVGAIKWVIATVVLAALTLLLGYLTWKAAQRGGWLDYCFSFYAFGVGAAFTGVLALFSGLLFLGTL